MGSDKALLEVGGTAMARRVADALAAGGCDPVLAIGGAAGPLRRLGLWTVDDLHPGEGPLGGIITAIDAVRSTCDAVVVVACDLAGIDGAVVAAVLGALGDHDVAVAGGDGPRPLCAAWACRAFGELQARFDAGERAVRRAGVGLDLVEVVVDARSLRNVNTPDDLAAMRAEVASERGPGPSTASPVAFPDVTIDEVTADELESALQDGVRLIDVRQPDEYEEAHVPGAVLVPLAAVADRLREFDPDGVTYVICRSGARSMKACELAAADGLRVVNVAGGTLAWIASGRDVVTGDQPT